MLFPYSAFFKFSKTIFPAHAFIFLSTREKIPSTPRLSLFSISKTVPPPSRFLLSLDITPLQPPLQQSPLLHASTKPLLPSSVLRWAFLNLAAFQHRERAREWVSWRHGAPCHAACPHSCCCSTGVKELQFASSLTSSLAYIARTHVLQGKIYLL